MDNGSTCWIMAIHARIKLLDFLFSRYRKSHARAIISFHLLHTSDILSPLLSSLLNHFLHSIYNPAANITAPPKSAPISTTPVGIAFAKPPAPALLELVVNGLVGVCVNVVLCTTPLVNGTSVAELAPLNATLVVLGFGVAAVLLGFRTPSITCTTPFATRTSGTMTRAEFT